MPGLHGGIGRFFLCPCQMCSVGLGLRLAEWKKENCYNKHDSACFIDSQTTKVERLSTCPGVAGSYRRPLYGMHCMMQSVVASSQRQCLIPNFEWLVGIYCSITLLNLVLIKLLSIDS